MKGIVFPAVLVLVSILLVSGAAEPPAASQAVSDVIVPGREDTASGALHALQTWQLGGIGGKWLAVGQPNTLNRDDRAVFRFGIAMYLFRGKVAKAVLQVIVNPQTRGETFRLDHFTGERTVLSAKDLGSAQVEKVTSIEVKKGTPAALQLSFDVTEQVNRDLEGGFGFSAFRFKSEFAETVGNPTNSPSLITIKNGTLALTITP